MFQFGNQNFIPRLQEALSVGMGDKIDPFGRTTYKDDFFAGACVEVIPDFITRTFKGIGGSRCQGVGAPVDIGIVMLVKATQSIDNLPRLLCCGGIIKPDQRLTMHLLMQDWKVGANSAYIKRWLPPQFAAFGERRLQQDSKGINHRPVSAPSVRVLKGLDIADKPFQIPMAL